MIGPVQSLCHEGSPVGKRNLRWEGFVEKVGFEPGVKEWWMMRVVTIIEMSWQVNEEVSWDMTGEADGKNPGVDSTDEVMHIWMSDLWFSMTRWLVGEKGCLVLCPRDVCVVSVRWVTCDVCLCSVLMMMRTRNSVMCVWWVWDGSLVMCVCVQCWWWGGGGTAWFDRHQPQDQDGQAGRSACVSVCQSLTDGLCTTRSVLRLHLRCNVGCGQILFSGE